MRGSDGQVFGGLIPFFSVFFFGLFFGLKGTAGAGSLILEFSLLSRLTGDDRYEVCSVNVLSSWDDRGAKMLTFE